MTQFEEIKEAKASTLEEETLKLKLKRLHEELKYAYLGDQQTYQVVVSSQLTSDQEDKLLVVLKRHKTTIGWAMKDIKDINHLICTNQIHLAKNAKITR